MLGRSARARLLPATALTAVMLSGCGHLSSGPAEVSERIRGSLLPSIGAFSGVDQLPDWRGLDRPTAELREYFDDQRATYRVINASSDFAELAVWQTGPPTGEPFNANRIVTGTGCVALQRQSVSITSTVIDCPSPLAQTQPPSTDLSWGRDSEAMRRAAVLIDGSVDQDVRWLMTKEADGLPRTTTRTLDQVVVAVHLAAVSEGESVILSGVQQQGRIVTGVVTAHASGVDPVDTLRTEQARACSTMTVDLDDVNPNYLFTEIPCPEQ